MATLREKKTFLPESSHHFFHRILKNRFDWQVEPPDGHMQELADAIQRLALHRHGDRQLPHFGALRPGEIVKLTVALEKTYIIGLSEGGRE